MRQLCLILAVVAGLALTRLAEAHPIPFSYLDLRLEPGRIEATLVAHVIDVAHELKVSPPERLLAPDVAEGQLGAIANVLQPRLQLSSDGRVLTPEWSAVEVMADRQPLKLSLDYRLDATSGVLGIRAFLFPYDPNHRTFLNVYESGSLRSQAILEADHQRVEYFAGTWQGTMAVVRKFVPAGIYHILIGPDHVLFLIGLLLLGGTLRQLLIVVTAFTVAH